MSNNYCGALPGATNVASSALACIVALCLERQMFRDVLSNILALWTDPWSGSVEWIPEAGPWSGSLERMHGADPCMFCCPFSGLMLILISQICDRFL